jgi:hypothetical protein
MKLILTQNAVAAPAGESRIGVIGSVVTVSNDGSTTGQYILTDAPSGSAVTTGNLGAPGATATFTPDMSGCYPVQLRRVSDNALLAALDFIVPEDSGDILPGYDSSGDTTSPLDGGVRYGTYRPTGRPDTTKGWKGVEVILRRASRLPVDGLPTNGQTLAFNGTTKVWDPVDPTVPPIPNGSITTAKLADGAVTATKMAASTITATQIADGTVTGTKMAPSTITATQIADGAVTATKMAPSTITTTQLADASITTVKVADGAMTTLKMADNAVTTLKMADNAVTTLKMADASVTALKMAANAITDVSVSATANISGTKIAAASIPSSKLTNNGVAAGTYTNANVTVDAKGLVTSISAGTPPLTPTYGTLVFSNATPAYATSPHALDTYDVSTPTSGITVDAATGIFTIVTTGTYRVTATGHLTSASNYPSTYRVSVVINELNALSTGTLNTDANNHGPFSLVGILSLTAGDIVFLNAAMDSGIYGIYTWGCDYGSFNLERVA